MSIRLKALLVAVQVSVLLWGLMVYGCYSVYIASANNIDPIATASTH
jgi:hypothetical protein